MQITFDTRDDGMEEARRLRDMMDAYINGRSKVHITNEVSVSGCTSPQVAQQVARAIRREEGPALDPVFQQSPPTVDGTTGQPLSFTPGDLSGSAPSDVGAAASPSAPEAPADGVPMPPTVAQVPAPPATAPAAPAVHSTPAPTDEGLDSTGLPWDKRIHSSSKAKNADGSWRKLRGLNDGALVARVEAELRAAAANGSIAVVPAGAGATAVVITPPTGATVPPPPGAPVPPPAPAAPDTMTASGLMEWVTPRMMDGRLTFDNVAAALQANGVDSLAALKDNPAAVPGVFAALGGE